MCDHRRSRCVDTRKKHGERVRRHKCIDCGHRWSTVELEVKNPTNAKSSTEQVRDEIFNEELATRYNLTGKELDAIHTLFLRKS